MEPDRLRPQPEKPRDESAPQSRPLSRPLDDDEPASGSGVASGSENVAPPPRHSSTGKSVARKQTAPKPSGSGGKLVMAIVIAVMLAIGYFMFGGSSKASLAAETESPAYQKHKFVVAGSQMRLSRSDVDVQATKAAIEAAKAGRTIPGLSSATPELVNQIAAGEVEFYTVRAYDTCAEDGDWVTITSSNGAKMGSVMITKAGSSFSIPVVGGQVPGLSLTGDKDGVGGITVGIQTSGGIWYSDVLSEGQMQQIPLTIR